MNKEITVSEKNGRHVCHQTHTHVHSGDTVTWSSAGEIIIKFTGETPFMEGLGPFVNNQIQTVEPKPPVKKGHVFQPAITLNGKLLPTEGDIIFDGG